MTNMTPLDVDALAPLVEDLSIWLIPGRVRDPSPAITQAVDAELQAFGLTDATWRPLAYVGRLGGGVRQKELAIALAIEGPSLVRLLIRHFPRLRAHRPPLEPWPMAQFIRDYCDNEVRGNVLPLASR